MQISTLAMAAALALTVPVAAAPQQAGVQLAAYGDVPASGARHRGRKRGPVATTPDAVVPDLHGATREDADKQYRKKYGF